MQGKLIVGLVAVIVALVAALAFTLGRQATSRDTEAVTATPIQPPQRKAMQTTSIAAPTSTAAKPLPIPASVYPQFVSTIPIAFRGRWDEIVTDKCADREARFYITATTVANFEVQSDVSKVKLYSPTEADISITGYDDDKNQYNDTMTLKVIDSGKTLTGRKGGTTMFHKCPSA